MASSPIPMPPSPDDSQAPSSQPTQPVPAAPAPADPSPTMDKETSEVIKVVRQIQEWAKKYPKWAPHAMAINDEMQSLFPIMMEQQKPGEPAAPPLGG